MPMPENELDIAFSVLKETFVSIIETQKKQQQELDGLNQKIMPTLERYTDVLDSLDKYLRSREPEENKKRDQQEPSDQPSSAKSA